MNSELTFLELSLPAADVRASLEWYRGLGFAELTTNDARDYPYAVVSDGHLNIGLHGEHIEGPGLSFVRPELARWARRQETAGQPFERAALGIDQFHEVVQSDPDGTLAITTEARTFSSSHAQDAVPLAGEIDKLCLPCMRVDESVEFWQGYGFIAVAEEDAGHAELHAPGLVIELSEGTRGISLHCSMPADEAARAQLERDYAPRKRGRHYELTAPEGTRMIFNQASPLS